jgi:nucleoside-diphosphate-sugar epimerase
MAVTGGTGALGFAFLRRSFGTNPGLRARLLVRQSSESFQSPAFQGWLAQHRNHIHLLEGDLRQEIPAGLIDPENGLWHFAALTALKSSPAVAQETTEINVEGTRRLVDACRRARAPFFHISTAYIAGTRRGWVRETETDLGQTCRNPYESSKLAAELIVQQAFAEGLTGAIFRPSVVVDDASGTGAFKMVDACAYAVTLAIKRGEPFVFRLPAEAQLNLVHSDWVIAAMLDLARLPSGHGRTYHLTTPRATRMRDIAAILEAHVPGLRWHFEPDLTRAQLPSASKIFDKAIAELRPYFESDVQFDRSHTEEDLSPELQEPPLDLESFVLRRLRNELNGENRAAIAEPSPRFNLQAGLEETHFGSGAMARPSSGRR